MLHYLNQLKTICEFGAYTLSKCFSHACSVSEAAPSEKERGKIQLEYDSLPSACRRYEATCQLDSQLDEI